SNDDEQISCGRFAHGLMLNVAETGIQVTSGTPSFGKRGVIAELDSSKSHCVVGRRPIDCRNRLLVQTQVHTELGAVMHQVVEKHLPVREKALPFEDRLTLPGEPPVLLPCL